MKTNKRKRLIAFSLALTGFFLSSAAAEAACPPWAVESLGTNAGTIHPPCQFLGLPITTLKYFNTFYNGYEYFNYDSNGNFTTTGVTVDLAALAAYGSDTAVAIYGPTQLIYQNGQLVDVTSATCTLEFMAPNLVSPAIEILSSPSGTPGTYVIRANMAGENLNVTWYGPDIHSGQPAGPMPGGTFAEFTYNYVPAWGGTYSRAAVLRDASTNQIRCITNSWTLTVL